MYSWKTFHFRYLHFQRTSISLPVFDVAAASSFFIRLYSRLQARRPFEPLETSKQRSDRLNFKSWRLPPSILTVPSKFGAHVWGSKWNEGNKDVISRGHVVFKWRILNFLCKFCKIVINDNLKFCYRINKRQNWNLDILTLISVVFRCIRKIAKIDSWLLHVRLSVCPFAWNKSSPNLRILMKFGVWTFFETLSRKFNFH
jgi:hypothetical protein